MPTSAKPDTAPPGELAASAARGTLWTYWTFGASKLVVFIITIVLARLLSPDDFGLVAIGLVLITYLDTISDFGVVDAFIYHNQDVERAAGVTLTINVGAGVITTLLAFLAAPWVAAFFHEPRATLIIQALALTFVIESVGATYEAQLKKQMKFSRRSWPELTKMIVRGVISIGMALTGFGVWSLVWGQLLGRLVATWMYGHAASWNIRPRFDWEMCRSLVRYGSNLVLLEILSTLDKDIDYVFVGQRLFSEQLGYYTMAYRIPDLVILGFCYILSSVLFPAFTKLQNDAEGLRRGFLMVSRYIALITVPVGVGLALVAADFVNVFYTAKWAPAIPVMRLLALYAVAYSLSFNMGDVYKATGRPGILNVLTGLKLVVTVPSLWLASSYNIVWVGAAQLAVMSLLSLVNLAVGCRMLKLSPLAVWQAMQPAFLSTLVMAAGVLLLQSQLNGMAAWARLLVVSISGSILYAGALGVFSRPTVIEAFQLARKVLRPRAAL
jgi:O-antigen/teichoic acid export membrane protein